MFDASQSDLYARGMTSIALASRGRRGGWRFALVAWVLPLGLAYLGVPFVGILAARLVRGESELGDAFDTVGIVGLLATIAAVGFARTTRGLVTERVRYRALPMTVALASVGAAAVVGALGTEPSGPVTVALTTAGAVAGGALGRIVALAICPVETMPDVAGPAPSGLLRQPLAAGATAVWSARLPALSPVAWLRFPALFALWSWRYWSDSTSTLRLVLALVLTFIGALWTLDWRARVTIGPAGLQVRAGIGGRLWQSVPLTAIVGARRVVARRDLRWRSPQWSVPGQTALVPSNGEALLARLSDGTQFVVRLDDVDTAVGVLNTLLDRRGEINAVSPC